MFALNFKSIVAVILPFISTATLAHIHYGDARLFCDVVVVVLRSSVVRFGQTVAHADLTCFNGIQAIYNAILYRTGNACNRAVLLT